MHWRHWRQRPYIVRAGLLQRWPTIRNSLHSDKTAVISSEYRGPVSARSKIPGPYHFSTQSPLASGAVKNRFQILNRSPAYMNSAYRLNMSELVLVSDLHQLDIHFHLPRVQTNTIRQQRLHPMDP